MVAMRSLAKVVVVIAACKGSISIPGFFIRTNLSGIVKNLKLIESSSWVVVPKGQPRDVVYEKASRENGSSLTETSWCTV